MVSRAISDLDPTLQPLAQQFLSQCAAVGLEAILTVTYRSAEEQDAAYASGRTTAGPIITDAKGNESPHNCTLSDGTPTARAFDFALYEPGGKSLDWNASDEAWKTAIKIGEGLGLVSGSTFKFVDADHFEISNWCDLNPITPNV